MKHLKKRYAIFGSFGGGETMTLRGLIFATCAASLIGASHGRAEWPADKPIELIVAFAPGGGTDVMIRALAPFIEKNLPGAKFAILNKPGASGEITYTAVSESEPDGYTFSSLNTPGFITIQLSRKLGFDPATVEPVVRIVEDPSLLVVAKDSPFNSLADLVEYAKKNPRAVTIGGTGIGGDEHLVMLQIERDTGADMTIIPFNGASEVKTALLGGHITAMGLNMGEYLSTDNANLKALVQLSDTRSSALPDLPTAKELGYQIQSSSERGFGVNKDVPEEIKRKFAEAVGKALDDPEFQAKAKSLALPLSFMSGTEWSSRLPAKKQSLETIWELTKAPQ
jgi:tripartite-type tricarboxylate transporter receptor subunit TctC